MVVYDGINSGIAAVRYDGPGALESLWRNDLRNNVQMMLYPDTGELVVEDIRFSTPRGDTTESADAVVLDIETGEVRGRATLGSPATSGMFPCPGFDRDFYVATHGDLS